MKSQKIIRYGVFFFGVIVMMFVTIPNVEANGKLDNTLIYFYLWNILPHTIFLFTTFKIKSFYLLLTPAILLCSFQLLIIIDYFYQSGSTSALIFIFLPIYEGILMGFGFLVGHLIELYRNKNSENRQ